MNTNLLSSLVVGLSSGIFWHPLDKALFQLNTTPIENRKPLFHPDYWQNPMRGLKGTIAQRLLSNGLYFGIQGELNSQFLPHLIEQRKWGIIQANTATGIIAGTVSGFFSNGTYAMKFRAMQLKVDTSFTQNARDLYREEGFKGFTKGSGPGVFRDIVSGGTYEGFNAGMNLFFKSQLDAIPEDYKFTKLTAEWLIRFSSAWASTVASAPLNFARNAQFNAPANQMPNTIDLWCKSWMQSSEIVQSLKGESQFSRDYKHTRFPRLRFFQQKFNIGPGTARNAAGMAVNSVGFKHLKDYLNGRGEDKDKKKMTP